MDYNCSQFTDPWQVVQCQALENKAIFLDFLQNMIWLAFVVFFVGLIVIWIYNNTYKKLISIL